MELEWLNALYQVAGFIILLGLVGLIVYIVYAGQLCKKRLQKIEEKIEDINQRLSNSKP